MAANRITFNNKVRVIVRNNPDNELGKADDFNEIKTVANDHADDIDALTIEQSNQAGRITQNEADISDLQTEQGLQGGRITVNEANILALQTEQGLQDGRITTNENDIISLNNEQTTQNNRITQNEEDIIANTVLANSKEPEITGATANDYWNGLKSFVDFATSVRGAILTGLSLATNAAVTEADSVLIAIGKLQTQVTSALGRITQNENDISNKLDQSGGTMTGAILGDQEIRAFTGVEGTDISASIAISSLTVNVLHPIADAEPMTITIDDAADSNPIGTEYRFYLRVFAGNLIQFATAGSQTIISEDGHVQITKQGQYVKVKKVDDNTWLIIGAN